MAEKCPGMMETQHKRESSLEVKMNDTPKTTVPLRVDNGDLQWIFRRQKFKVWLVAKLADTATMHTIKMCTWDLETEIKKKQ